MEFSTLIIILILLIATAFGGFILGSKATQKGFVSGRRAVFPSEDVVTSNIKLDTKQIKKIGKKLLQKEKLE